MKSNTFVLNSNTLIGSYIKFENTSANAQNALYYYKMEVKDGLIKTEFVLNDELLVTEYTTLKRFAYYPDPHYWYGVGVLFKPGAIPVGEYILSTTVSFYLGEEAGWFPISHVIVGFNMVECWH